MTRTLQNDTFYGEVRASRRIGGVSLAETTYAAGFEVPPHDHAHPFFCLGLSGSFQELFDGRSWKGHATTVFFHPSGAEHAERFGEEGGRLFNIQLGASWLERLAPFDIRPPERQVESAGGRMTSLAGGLYREYHRDDDASRLAIDGLTLALLAEVIRHAQPRTRGSRPGWLGRVEELLHDRAGQPMSLASIAAEVEIHPVHVARVFRRHHGCTPAEYLRRLRVRRACHMLAAGRESLSAVAFANGFADQSHFTREFRRVVGLTPGVYRRIARQ